MTRLYLDNAAGSFPKAPGVAEAMADYLLHNGCNLGRGSYQTAAEAEDIVLDLRIRLGRLLGFGDPSHVVLTSGVTESLNLLIRGLLGPGDHCIVSGFEHNAVMRPLLRTGAEWTAAQLDESGHFAHPEALFRPNTKLVVMTHASNVFGNRLPLEEMGRLCRERGVPFAVDCAQTAGHLPVDMEQLCADALCFAGHKGLLGPAGTGGVLLRRELARRLPPLIEGGTGSASDRMETPDLMPDKFEAGTRNIPGLWGLHAALGFLEANAPAAIAQQETVLRRAFLDGLAQIPGVHAVCAPGVGQTGVVSVVFERLDQAEAAWQLEEQHGIQTRCGLHCAPLAHRTMGTFPEGTVRFSFGIFNTAAEIGRALEAIAAVCRTA